MLKANVPVVLAVLLVGLLAACTAENLGQAAYSSAKGACRLNPDQCTVNPADPAMSPGAGRTDYAR